MAQYGEIQVVLPVECQGCVPHEVEQIYWTAAGSRRIHLDYTKMPRSWDPDGPAPDWIEVNVSLPAGIYVGAETPFSLVDGNKRYVAMTTISDVCICRMSGVTHHAARLAGYENQWRFRDAWNEKYPDTPWQSWPWVWMLRCVLKDRSLLLPADARAPTGPG